MLIDSEFKANDIIAMRIQGGDEVIAKFLSQDDKIIKVSKPLALTMTPQGMGMTQYIMMADMNKSFSINKSAVVTMQLARKMRQTTTSKGPQAYNLHQLFLI